jgi:2-polyprenyl-3-methyl-5-hydroxy-6-metoxy-1,4-benzoquinol methylase
VLVLPLQALAEPVFSWGDMAEVREHYDAAVEDSRKQYQRKDLENLDVYPANYFRLQALVNSFVRREVKRVLEVGVGEGTPLIALGKTGMDVWGFDLSDKMVEAARKNFKDAGFDADRICWGDIQDSLTYTHLLRSGLFDGVLAMGVMPHVANDSLVLDNIATCLRPNGSVFIEFRNKLFSLFTFNRLTYDFILDDLLAGVDQRVRDAVAQELKPRLRMDLPPSRDTLADGAPGYDAILSRFHNPFEVMEVFRRKGFKDIELLWYHYHPALPMLESKLGPLFRKEALKLEHETSGWRGLFLCSAFVVEATRG